MSGTPRHRARTRRPIRSLDPAGGACPDVAAAATAVQQPLAQCQGRMAPYAIPASQVLPDDFVKLP